MLKINKYLNLIYFSSKINALSPTVSRTPKNYSKWMFRSAQRKGVRRLKNIAYTWCSSHIENLIDKHLWTRQRMECQVLFVFGYVTALYETDVLSLWQQGGWQQNRSTPIIPVFHSFPRMASSVFVKWIIVSFGNT